MLLVDTGVVSVVLMQRLLEVSDDDDADEYD
jgi:hypothetical protein